MKNEIVLVDIEGELIKPFDTEGELIKPFDTEKAFYFHNGSVKAWLPKSQVEWHPDKPDGNVGTMVIPTWLAENKGLI